jgi:hypothetical protein
MASSDELYAEADALRKKADELSAEASGVRRAELLAKPLLQRLIFAATARCDCGAGLAYDPASEGKPDLPFKGPSAWECGDILLFETLSADKQAAVKAAVHTPALPFVFYEIKSENQPSASGRTTRPVEGAAQC